MLHVCFHVANGSGSFLIIPFTFDRYDNTERITLTYGAEAPERNMWIGSRFQTFFTCSAKAKQVIAPKLPEKKHIYIFALLCCHCPGPTHQVQDIIYLFKVCHHFLYTLVIVSHTYVRRVQMAFLWVVEVSHLWPHQWFPAYFGKMVLWFSLLFLAV